MKLLNLLILLFTIYSCSDSKTKNLYEAFNIRDTIIVKPEILKTEKLLSSIWDLTILDSIILLQSDDGNGCLQLFNINNFKFLKTKGIYGRGPGEFISDNISLKTSCDSLFVHFLVPNILYTYSKTEFINDTTPDRVVTFNKYRGNYVIIPSRSNFVTRPTIKTRFALFNLNGDHLKDNNKYPVCSNKLDNSTVETIYKWFSMTEAKPDLSKIASISYLGGVLEIFIVKKDSLIKLIEKRFLNPNVRNSKNHTEIIRDDSNIGFTDIYTTNHYIYAAYSGLIFREFNKKFLSDYIVIFDWDGNVKKLIKVQGGLLQLAVDENNKTIFITTSNSNSEDVVGYFKFNISN